MRSTTKSVKLPGSMARALKKEARRRGTTESELIREGIERVVARGEGLDMETELRDGLGVAEGPPDLSTARKHLKGYGTSRRR
jgi:predicted DNA-binding protein